MSRNRFLPLTMLVVLVSSCTDRLPDHDLRITEVQQPAFKLSAPDLWKDFQTDPAAARSRYFGKSVDVSAVVSRVEIAAPSPHVYFAQTTSNGVKAMLLDDRAAETTKDVKVGDRVTLRCYVEGLDEKQDVLLKSCIRP